MSQISWFEHCWQDQTWTVHHFRSGRDRSRQHQSARTVQLKSPSTSSRPTGPSSLTLFVVMKCQSPGCSSSSECFKKLCAHPGVGVSLRQLFWKLALFVSAKSWTWKNDDFNSDATLLTFASACSHHALLFSWRHRWCICVHQWHILHKKIQNENKAKRVPRKHWFRYHSCSNAVIWNDESWINDHLAREGLGSWCRRAQKSDRILKV